MIQSLGGAQINDMGIVVLGVYVNRSSVFKCGSDVYYQRFARTK